MKKIFFLTILCFLAVSCSYTPPPNPGFRVLTEIDTPQGVFPFRTYIPAPKSGTVTNGDYHFQAPGSAPLTGTVGSFIRKVSSVGGIFDVDNGYAPGVWYFQAFSGWQVFDVNCNGAATFASTQPGGTTELRCYVVGGFHFPLSPSFIDVNSSAPVEFQAYVNGIDTSYGMPVFHFEDYTGKVIGIDTANMVNGTDVRVTSGCLVGKPVGTYTVKVYNGLSKHNLSSEPIGISSVVIRNPPQDCWAYTEMRQECELNGGIWKGCRGCYSPIVIDVLGNGYNLTNGRNGIEFDLTGEGSKDKISWTSADSDDAWLVLDRNRNYMVDSGLELFGNFTAQDSSIPAKDKNGFLALAVFDKPNKGGNGDGVIDNRDAIFTSLQLWQDKNHNGKSEPNELSTLSSLDIAKLELDYRVSRRTDEHGNKFKYRAKVWDANKAKVGRWAWDVFLLKGE